MAKHTIVFNDFEEEALTFATAEHNKTVAGKDLTVDEFLQLTINIDMKKWLTQFKAAELKLVTEKLVGVIATNNDLVLDKIKVILGLRPETEIPNAPSNVVATVVEK